MSRIILILLLFANVVYGSEIKIISNCITLSDLFLTTSEKKVKCLTDNDDYVILNREFLEQLSLKYRYLTPRFQFIDGVKVVKIGKKLTLEELKEVIKNFYGKNFPSIETEIERVTVYKPILYVDESNIKLEFMGNKKFGSVYFKLHTGVRDYRIYAYIRAYGKVYVAKERIVKNTLLKNFVVKKRMDITNLLFTPIKRVNDLIAARTIPKGRIITEKYVRNKPDLFKGSIIKLKYESDKITILMEGKLLDDAYKNRMVTVENVTSGKKITAKYLGNGLAVVIN